MITVKHKFRNFNNNSDIQFLILGTFNPDADDNTAEFFYGRGRNYLWNLLPKVFNHLELKTSSYSDKVSFIQNNKIGFLDIIQEVEVENGNETNYADSFIDKKVSKWTDFESFIENYPAIKNVYFTRKTFNGIPNMEKRIGLIKEICQSRGIGFYTLPTPARFENQEKANEWRKIFSL